MNGRNRKSCAREYRSKIGYMEVRVVSDEKPFNKIRLLLLVLLFGFVVDILLNV